MKNWTEKKILDLFVEKKIITAEQQTEILKIVSDTDQKATHILAEKKLALPSKINLILAQANCPDLTSYFVDSKLTERFQENKIRKHGVMPLFVSGSNIYVSMLRPDDFESRQMIGFSSGYTSIRNIDAPDAVIQQMIDKYFGRRAAIMEAIREVGSRNTGNSKEKNAPTLAIADAPIVKLVEEYLSRALELNASDIHFEPREDSLCVRMRIDGRLHTIESIPSSLIGPMTSRLKIMSQMKIDIRMVPQDGRFSRIIKNTEIDFRVSSFPGIFGESIVLRLLKRKMRVQVNDLGLSKATLANFRKVLNQDKGMFLVTGPTGCGKTTTLVSILHEIKDPTKKIITLENPVEYQIEEAVQGQIHPQAGFTFSKGLRAILRHDPNIIMVAEIRDPETASIAIEAGLTGHFVLSTLHTNNAPSTIIRLLEMGMEPFILASSLIGVLAQRLVRVICRHCREIYVPNPQILKSIGLRELPSNIKLYKGKGCPKCRDTGYSGRTGIFEFMPVTEKMRRMIIAGASTSQIEIEARKAGMRTLREDGIRKVLQGITTFEEIMGVTQEASTGE